MKFTEKLLAYKQRQKPSRSLIHSDVDLPTGSNVREVLEKLMESRRVGSVPAEEPIKLRPKRYFAICIVIVDQLYHEEIWKRWIEEGSTPTSSYGAEIFIHAKYPERIQSPWIQSRLIEKSFSPEWNSTEVVRAMLQLLSFTLHSQTLHPQTDFERLIFATESCIPVLPLHECGNLLFASDHSWVDAYNTPKNTWEDRNCFKPVNRDIIPPKAVTKAIPGWIMLVKKHAEEIVALLNRFGGWDFRESERPSGSQIVDIVSAFGPSGQWTEFCGGVFAPEEVFFPTMLSLLGYIQPENPSKEEIIRKPVIYAEWKRNGDANPISFSSLTKDLLDKISQKKIPFARKFPKDSISVEVWSSLVLTDLSKVEDEDAESSSEPQLKKLKS